MSCSSQRLDSPANTAELASLHRRNGLFVIMMLRHVVDRLLNASRDQFLLDNSLDFLPFPPPTRNRFAACD